MNFFFKRKLLKDQLAGLVFCWRGRVLGDSILGVLVSMMIVLFIVVFVFYGVKVKVSTEFTSNRAKEGRITFLDANHPQIRSKTEFASPFPDRWDPLEDEVVNARAQALSRVAVLKREYAAMPLIEVKELQLDSSLPQVSAQGRFLPELEQRASRAAPEKGMCSLSLHSDFKPLRVRLPIMGITNDDAAELLRIRKKLNWEDRGKSYQYVVSISPEGKVLQCSPVGDEAPKFLEQWLRKLSFIRTTKSDKVLVGKLEIQVTKGGGKP